MAIETEQDGVGKKPDNSQAATRLSMGIALGASAGTMLFVITGNAFWISIGAGLGTAGGAIAMAAFTESGS